jgi:hypothetical protein
MDDDSKGGHDEVDLTAVLESVRTAPAIVHGDEGAAALQITDVIADYQYSSSGYEIDLGALFDNVAENEAINEAGPQTIAAESPAGGEAGDEIDLSALFDTGDGTGGHGGGGFAASTMAVQSGVINALYGDDGHDHPGTATG